MAAGYTLRKLTAVRDSAPDFGQGDVQEIRFATADLDAENTGVALKRVRPNTRVSLGHRHERAEEVYVVLSGAGRVRLDDEIVDVEPLDALRVAPPVIRILRGRASGPRSAGLRATPRRRRRAAPRLVDLAQLHRRHPPIPYRGQRALLTMTTTAPDPNRILWEAVAH